MNTKIQIVVRMERSDLTDFDRIVKKSGLSREEFIRTLCGIVTKLDCKPSETEKLCRAYRGDLY